jgi:hypothetical protein
MIKFNTTIFKRFGFATLAVFMSCVTMLGFSGKALAAAPNLYFTQINQMVSGGTLYVQVHANSATTPVNAIQADFTYPTSLLSFVAIDSTTSAFDITASQSGGSGSVTIQRGSTTPKTGDLYVATVAFNVASSGVASLAFQGSSVLLRSSDNTDILSSKDNLNIQGYNGPLIPVYRMYNRHDGDRLFTINSFERDSIVTPTTWRYEGIAFNAFLNESPGTIPVYRMYNRHDGDRLFTINSNERDSIVSPTGWRYEGVAFYALMNESPGTIPVYRMYNRHDGDRLFTINSFERDSLVTPTTWRYEGISFYGL